MPGGLDREPSPRVSGGRPRRGVGAADVAEGFPLAVAVPSLRFLGAVALWPSP